MSVRRLTRFCCVIRQTRCIQTAAWRMADEGEKDGGSNVAQSNKPRKRSVAAGDLLNVLSDLRVQRTNGEGPETSLARRKRVSAAANFQRMIAKAEKRKGKEGVEEEGEDSAGVTDEQKSPSLDELHEMTVEAAKEVAQVYPDREVVESELLKELRRHDDATAAGESGDLDSMSSVLSGIRVQRPSRIERQRDGHDENGQRSTSDFGASFSSLDENARDDREAQRKERNEPYQRQRKRTLFDRQKLNIFTALPEADSTHTGEMPSAEASLWQQELEKQLRALSYSMVRNGFEEAMKLTEEGKLWRYPIDNEQGLEEEQTVGFHEHVFLDHLLADFPQREQVLDFMELVLIGLGKNPFLTVAQKQDHVAWFQDYFWQKEEVFERLAEEEKQGKATAL